MNHKSFTLIELLVVIAIIGVLAAIIVTSMSGAITKSKIVRLQAFSDSIRAQLSDSLVSYWSFNEGTGTDAKDMWEGNNGTLGGGTPDYYPTWRSGGECVSGSCLEFDGENDYVDCGSDSSLDITDIITIEAWVYRLDNAISGAIVDKPPYMYTIMPYTNNKIIFYINSIELIGLENKFLPNQWIHIITIAKSTDYMKVYINGVFDTERTSGVPSLVATANNFLIGRKGSGTPSYFNGLIDEVRIYNSAASITQIQLQYLAGLDKLLSSRAITKSEYNQRIKELSKEIVIQ